MLVRTKSLLLLFLAFWASNSYAQMVLEYVLPTPYIEVKLPLNETYDVQINWGDGSAIQTFTNTGFGHGRTIAHTYSTSGIVTLTVSGTITKYGTNYGDNTPSNVYLAKVKQWKNLGITDLSFAFNNASNLTSVPDSLPSTVRILLGTFYNATAFNQNINTWDTKNVTDMNSLFWKASSFNQPLDQWNTSNVTDMDALFAEDTSFNQPIGNWDVSKVTSMLAMFYKTKKFNQPLSTWNTGNVTNMRMLFAEAKSFNQPIGSWNIEKVTNMNSIFYGVSLCTSVYDDILSSWSNQNVTTGVPFDGGNSKYSSSVASARNLLISKGWTIIDHGQGNSGGPNCVVTHSELTIPTPNSLISIYPNPFTHSFKLEMPQISERLEVIVSNIQGNIVLAKTFERPPYEIFPDDLPNGVYFLKASHAKGIARVKLIKD